MRRVFLDFQSSTPVAPEVFEGMRPFFSEIFGTSASLHQHGLRVRDALAEARGHVAALIGAESPETILFTSSGTEAANLAVQGVAYANQRRGDHLVVSAIEHPAVLRSVEFLESRGFSATRVAVDNEGRVNPEEVRAALTDRTILVCVHHANHDIGTLEPIAAISSITREAGIPLFVDAVASGGWAPLNVQTLGADLLSLSPHRFYGPKGVGILYRRRSVRMSPILHGGVQEEGRRAGTENVPGIVGAGLAAELAASRVAHRARHTSAVQARLWNELKRRVNLIRLHGPEPGPERLTTNLNISTEFIEGEAQALSLDMKGVAVSSGPSCVSKSLRVSPVLTAIGVEPALAQGNLIFSLGEENSIEEIDYVVEVFVQVVDRLRAMSPAWDDFQKGLINSTIAPRASSSNV